MQLVGAAEFSPEETNLVVLFHFVKFFTVLLIIGALVGSIFLHNRRRCHKTDEFLEELEQDEEPSAESEDDQWGKDPDWWKK